MPRKGSKGIFHLTTKGLLAWSVADMKPSVGAVANDQVLEECAQEMREVSVDHLAVHMTLTILRMRYITFGTYVRFDLLRTADIIMQGRPEDEIPELEPFFVNVLEEMKPFAEGSEDQEPERTRTALLVQLVEAYFESPSLLEAELKSSVSLFLYIAGHRIFRPHIMNRILGAWGLTGAQIAIFWEEVLADEYWTNIIKDVKRTWQAIEQSMEQNTERNWA